jgi:hypothetical protein
VDAAEEADDGAPGGAPNGAGDGAEVLGIAGVAQQQAARMVRRELGVEPGRGGGDQIRGGGERLLLRGPAGMVMERRQLVHAVEEEAERKGAPGGLGERPPEGMVDDDPAAMEGMFDRELGEAGQGALDIGFGEPVAIGVERGVSRQVEPPDAAFDRPRRPLGLRAQPQTGVVHPVAGPREAAGELLRPLDTELPFDDG